MAVELACAGRLRQPLTWVERRAAIERMAGWGFTDRQIAERIRSNPDAVQKTRRRHGIRAGTALQYAS